MTTATLTTPRLIVTIPEHPHKALSPNASITRSPGGAMAKARVIKAARLAGYAAARAAFENMVTGQPGIDLDLGARLLIREVASRIGPVNGYQIHPDHMLGWLAGPLTVETHIVWGVGASKKDGPNAQAMLKPHIDGISDWFGTSDRKWVFLPTEQTTSRQACPLGRIVFVFHPTTEDPS